MTSVYASHKYIVCIDFDGVVHSYTSGWKGATTIPDPPVPGAFRWISDLMSNPKFVPVIYSSRSKDEGGIEAMKQWFLEHGFGRDIDNLEFPTEKPAASMTVDDRAFCFQGDFPSQDWLLRFKPWHKR